MEEKEMKTPQGVLTKEISLWEDSVLEDPGPQKEGFVGTKKEILEALSKTLDESRCPLFNLVLHTNGRGSTGPFVNKIFILGRREVILYNLQKIAEKIAARKELKKDGVRIGFDPFRRPKIEDFI